MNDFETDVDDIATSQTWYNLLDTNDADFESLMLGKFNILVSTNCLLSSLDRRVSIELGARRIGFAPATKAVCTGPG